MIAVDNSAVISAERRRKILTDNVNGKNIADCKVCGEYLGRDTDCHLINSDRGLCGKSLLAIQYNERTNKYKLFQFGMK
jgi:hypothetical protein